MGENSTVIIDFHCFIIGLVGNYRFIIKHHRLLRILLPSNFSLRGLKLIHSYLFVFLVF